MPSASLLRAQIETALADRIPSALTPAPRIIRPVAATGVRELDALLEGGLPLGAITEMVGPESSGRTSVALSFVAQMTKTGKVCAWVDVSNALHPESAAASGVDLSRLLWVRCGVLDIPQVQPSQRAFSLPEKYLIPPPIKKGLHGGGFGPHPRNEIKGISEAVSGFLNPKITNPRSHELQGRRISGHKISDPVCPLQVSPAKKPVIFRKPWSRLDQALQVTDLLLQTGGFS